MKTKEELENYIKQRINEGKTIKEVVDELSTKTKTEAIDPSIPGGVDFPSLDHIYKRFFLPMPKTPQQMRANIQQALRAAARFGAKQAQNKE